MPQCLYLLLELQIFKTIDTHIKGSVPHTCHKDLAACPSWLPIGIRPQGVCREPTSTSIAARHSWTVCLSALAARAAGFAIWPMVRKAPDGKVSTMLENEAIATAWFAAVIATAGGSRRLTALRRGQEGSVAQPPNRPPAILTT